MIFTQLTQQLTSLHNLLAQLSYENYTFKIAHLGNASIGGHTRHIIELLQCAVNGYYVGEVDYVNRKRNIELETNKILAQQELENVAYSLRMPDKTLKLTVDQIEGHLIQEVQSTYYREIVYNTEHTIHHLALIKVALIDMKLYVVDADFGMADSTIKYKTSLSHESN